MRPSLDAILTRFPGLYRHDLLQYRMKDLGLTDVELAKLLHLDPFSLRRVLNGKAAGSKTLWPVSDYLGLDWKMMHDLELKKAEFHLAVRNGAGRVKGRSDLGHQHRP